MIKPWIGGEDFFNSHGRRRTSGKRGLEKLGGEEFLALFSLCDFAWKGEERDEESW
jgi:hypothetical protein